MSIEQKYYYQRGMCIALGYNSLNPVLYESYSENEDFEKKYMDCNAITQGKCKNSEDCKLLKDAPKRIPYKNFELYTNKIT